MVTDLYDYDGPGYDRIPYDERASERWMIFDSDGRWLGDVVTPLGFRLLTAYDERIVGVTKDLLDVERVVVFSLDKGA